MNRKNYEEAYWGLVTMKHAIALSLNNAAVWTLNEISISSAFNFARNGLNWRRRIGTWLWHWAG